MAEAHGSRRRSRPDAWHGCADRTAAAWACGLAVSAEQWTKAFALIPATHPKRADALKATIELKRCIKEVEAIQTGVGSPPAHDVVLAQCRKSLRLCVRHLLDLTYPVEDSLELEDFMNDERRGAALARLDGALEHALALLGLFREGDVDPSATAEAEGGGAEDLPEGMREMLQKAVAREDEKRKASPLDPGVVREREELARRWAESEAGRLSALLGEELFEGLCWRRGAIRHKLVTALCEATKSRPDLVEGAVLPVEVMREGAAALREMRGAQGPLGADAEDGSSWTRRALKGKAKRRRRRGGSGGGDGGGGGDNDTAQLFHHGIYSSTHLLALKFESELRYLEWRRAVEASKAPGGEDAGTELRAPAERALREFVHVVGDIMPKRGWTCEIERDRLGEVLRNAA